MKIVNVSAFVISGPRAKVYEAMDLAQIFGNRKEIMKMKYPALSVGDVFLRPTKVAFLPCQVVSFTEDRAILRDMTFTPYGWEVREFAIGENVSRFELKRWEPCKLKLK